MVVSLTKLDAARRQLNEAIRLWFHDGDPVTIHCLTCSAHQIVHDLNQKKGWRDLLYDSLVIRDEYQKEWARKLKAPYNFFKHADKDPDNVLEFDPALTEFFILFSLMGLELLGQRHDEVSGAYIIWASLHRPDLLTENGRKRFIDQLPVESRQRIEELSKPEFFRVYTALRKRYVSTEPGTSLEKLDTST